MIITRYGAAFVKVQQGDMIFAFNPISREADPKAAKFGANAALVSLRDPMFNGTDNVTFGSKEPMIIDGPGEYETGGIFVRGFPSDGPDEKINTIYTTIIDGIRICHLGGLAKSSLSMETIEELGAIDILFLPISGGRFLSPKDAIKLATSLEAKMIVPVLYNTEAELKAFLKEAGEEKIDSVDKLSIKKKDVEEKEGEIIIINS